MQLKIHLFQRKIHLALTAIPMTITAVVKHKATQFQIVENRNRSACKGSFTSFASNNKSIYKNQLTSIPIKSSKNL